MTSKAHIDPLFGVENARYWSSTTAAEDSLDGVTFDMAWFVYFGAGGNAAHSKEVSYYVRAVLDARTDAGNEAAAHR